MIANENIKKINQVSIFDRFESFDAVAVKFNFGTETSVDGRGNS